MQPRSSRPQATTPIDDRLIQDVVRRIVERFHPIRVVLFGSFARGDARAHSDLDLFVEMETPLRPPQRAIEISREFGLRPWALHVIVYTPQEAERFRGVPGSFLNTIEAEGKVLYDQNRGGSNGGQFQNCHPELQNCHPERSEGSGSRLDAERSADAWAEKP